MSNVNKESFKWVDEWDKRGDRSPESLLGWAHPGMATTKKQEIITCDSGESRILVFSVEGELVTSWKGNFVDAHGITVAQEENQEVIWIADNGSKRESQNSYEYPPGFGSKSGRVFKCLYGGEEVLELAFPKHSAYKENRYSPTSVAVDEIGQGGSGDIWVSDGYGANLVHRYSRDGEYNFTIDGSHGAGHFNCPHGIFIDRRRDLPELYVADRANSRIQVFDLEGRFIRSFGSDFLTTPSGFSTYNQIMIIAELNSRLVLIDDADNFIEYLFMDEKAPNYLGWPNEQTESGTLSRPSTLAPYKFNSPHGITVDSIGNIYVAEWLIGGRITKLKKIKYDV